MKEEKLSLRYKKSRKKGLKVEDDLLLQLKKSLEDIEAGRIKRVA